MFENLISSATSYEKSIIVIPKTDCREGIRFLQDNVHSLLGVISFASLCPIETGGRSVGKAIYEISALQLVNNPLRMSHYDKDNKFLPKAWCKKPPDINLIALPENKTLPVIFADAVVESQGTVIGAIETINQLIDKFNRDHNSSNPYPEYFTRALVSKFNGDSLIPNFVYAFKVDNRIWVHGWSCDDGHKGRTKRAIWGRMAEGENIVGIPQPPYAKRKF